MLTAPNVVRARLIPAVALMPLESPYALFTAPAAPLTYAQLVRL